MTVSVSPEVGLEFSFGEYSRRWANLQARLRGIGVDALLVDEAENIRYLMGYLPTATRYQYIVMPATGSPVACVRSLDEPVFTLHVPIQEYVTFSDGERSEELPP